MRACVSLCVRARVLPEGLVSRCVDDQHARDPQVFFVKLCKDKGKERLRETDLEPKCKHQYVCLCVCAWPHVFDHLGLLLDGLPGDVGGSDLLCDPSGLAVLDVGVSQLQAPNLTKL